MKKKLLLIPTVTVALLGLTGCVDDAAMASYNLSKAADNFEISRRIVFYNGITGEYILTIQGLCSIDSLGSKLSVTCKEPDGYQKHYLGLSDNVTYFSQQLSSKKVSVYHSRITFKPQSIIADVDFRGSITDTPTIDNKD